MIKKSKYITGWEQVPVIVDPYYIAEMMQCNVQCVYKLIRNGRIKAVKFERAYRITKESLQEFIYNDIGA